MEWKDVDIKIINESIVKQSPNINNNQSISRNHQQQHSRNQHQHHQNLNILSYRQKRCKKGLILLKIFVE